MMIWLDMVIDGQKPPGQEADVAFAAKLYQIF